VPPGGDLGRGQSLAGTVFFYPSAGHDVSNPDWCDIYLVVRIPSGAFYAFIPPRRWRRFDMKSGAPATVENYPLKREGRKTAFVQTLGRNLPLGTYTFYSILVYPGADPRGGGPDLKTTSFVLTE
jgi:hypothetical protein